MTAIIVASVSLQTDCHCNDKPAFFSSRDPSSEEDVQTVGSRSPRWFAVSHARGTAAAVVCSGPITDLLSMLSPPPEPHSRKSLLPGQDGVVGCQAGTSASFSMQSP
eukprot:TRINITY_DN15354_c0_g1_i3.p2 TRINITY_DN15354_c0_g1~~TRINITY_DN15354_c0_g1_i3.p2  ORF type:complete len:107 (+),score=12.91 TRINITY_DN15354_c0_g1_i3:1193-1513(+)